MGNHWSLSTDAAEDSKPNCAGTVIETKTKGESAIVLAFVSGTGFDLLEGERCLGRGALKDLDPSRKFTGAGPIYTIKLQDDVVILEKHL